MSAEEGESESGSGEGGIGPRRLSAHGPQEEQKDDWSPDRSVQHLGPSDGAAVAAQSERRAGDDGGRATALQVATEPVTEERPHVVQEDEVPIQMRKRDTAIAQRQKEQDPVEWIGYAGLSLSDERLAAPMIRVPERESALMPFGRLKLIPGQHLVDDVRMIEPGVVIGESELPENTDSDEEQDDRTEERMSPSHGSARCAFRRRKNARRGNLWVTETGPQGKGPAS